MSVSKKYGGYPLRPVDEGGSPVEQAFSAISVLELASDPKLDQEIHINAEGVVQGTGQADDHFTEALSYGTRLAALVGNMLGLDRLTSVDLHFKNKRWALAVGASGEMVAKRIGGAEDLRTFKHRWGVGG